MDLDQANWIHFIGIGGIGSSALANILLRNGKKISGSDPVASEITKKLELAGVQFYDQQIAANIDSEMDLVIYSPAVPESNKELVAAREAGISCMSYPQALGKLTEKFFTIAVAGTHGKSTTTAMTALILEKAGFDPTVVIGTKVPQFAGENFRVGEKILEKKFLIIEACEYKDSFLNFDVDLLLITNVEADHLDYFGTAESYFKTFEKFEEKVLVSGGKVIKNDQKLYTGKLKVIGDFNRQNARLAELGAKELGISQEVIAEALEDFGGTWRRMELKLNLQKNGSSFTQFFDDYGHHPTEIKVTLKALRGTYPTAKILCIFQPHQYSRTKFLLEEFGSAFWDADAVIIPDIYAVRDSEEDMKSVSVDDLVEKIRIGSFEKREKKFQNSIGKDFSVKNGDGLRETAKWISNHYRNYDIIITMGAGNITGIYDLFEFSKGDFFG